jgi:hypothetical protein
MNMAVKLRRLIGREFLAWSVIGVIAAGAVFIQSCPDHANAEAVGEEATTFSQSAWSAFFTCPIHQTFIVPAGETQGS